MFSKKYLPILVTLAVFLVGTFIYLFSQIFALKTDIPANITFEIKDKQSGGEIFANLEKEKIVRDDFWLKVLAKVLKKQKFYRGQYAFDEPISTWGVLKTITTRPPSLAVLIPEGFTKKQVADRLEKYIRNFNKKDFLQKAEEGYLYPDTYYFFAFSTNEEILKEFSNKFSRTMLESFGRMPTEKEVIIASMLEREAKEEEDMKIISGIIQNRLKINMPLQIDATVQYGNGVWKERVLYSDLRKENDYNTYINTGLPIAPISNPGIKALRAAVHPTKTKYFYYLTGRDGKMYYAVTHDEHVKNKITYLLK